MKFGINLIIIIFMVCFAVKSHKAGISVYSGEGTLWSRFYVQTCYCSLVTFFLSKILKEKISGRNIVYSCANELSATECTCRERDVPFGEEPK